ncbi:MAG: hypothetical protein LC733_10665 [Actinobacteria bacterium]|nr:hypothetical protein [Actinomycetota bacterium]
MTQVGIRNLTARRLSIANLRSPGSPLIIPPFGERLVPTEDLEQYAYESWASQRLIRVEPFAFDDEHRSPRMVWASVAGLVFLLGLGLGVAGVLTHDERWYGGALLGVLTALFCAQRTGWHADAWRHMRRSLNIFFGLMITFGAAGAAIAFMVSKRRLSLDDPPELGLAVVILWLFVGMASVLPASLFLFFHRQKVPTLRENFLRDVVRLDPNVQTIEDAEARYDTLIREVYGSPISGMSSRGRLPILAATGVVSGLWIWTLVPGLRDTTTIRSVLIPEPDVVSFAFLGAYVFAINMLFRRYTRTDLGPKAYTHIVIRIFAAVTSVWVLSFAPFARTDDGESRALMLLLAFFVGIIPETGTAIVQDLLQGWKPIGKAVPSLAEDHPLSRLDGISLYDRSHLLEVGIENIESLAHHSIVDLMLWTRMPTARIVDFVDQAVLYLHVRGPAVAAQMDGDPNEARMLLWRHGIRTATDLERAYALASSRSTDEGDRLLTLLDSPGVNVRRLRIMLDAMEDDEWMVYVRNWREMSLVDEPVTSVEQFVKLSTRSRATLRLSSNGSAQPALIEGRAAPPTVPAAPAPATETTAAMSVARGELPDEGC